MRITSVDFFFNSPKGKQPYKNISRGCLEFISLCDLIQTFPAHKDAANWKDMISDYAYHYLRFISNKNNFGIVPLTFKNEVDYTKIDQGDNIEIPNIKSIIEQGRALKVKNKTKGVEFEVDYNLSDRQREIVLAGGTLAYMKNRSK